MSSSCKYWAYNCCYLWTHALIPCGILRWRPKCHWQTLYICSLYTCVCVLNVTSLCSFWIKAVIVERTLCNCSLPFFGPYNSQRRKRRIPVEKCGPFYMDRLASSIKKSSLLLIPCSVTGIINALECRELIADVEWKKVHTHTSTGVPHNLICVCCVTFQPFVHFLSSNAYYMHGGRIEETNT